MRASARSATALGIAAAVTLAGGIATAAHGFHSGAAARAGVAAALPTASASITGRPAPVAPQSSAAPDPCRQLTGASDTTPPGPTDPAAATAEIGAALPAAWLRDDVPAKANAGDSLDVLGAASPNFTGVAGGFTMSWVPSVSPLAPEVEAERRVFGTPSQAAAAEENWCELLTAAAGVGGGATGSTGVTPFGVGDGGIAFGLPPGGPLGTNHAGVTVVALHRAGTLLTVGSAGPQPDLPPAAQRRVTLAAARSALGTMLVALDRQSAAARTLPTSPRALLELAAGSIDTADGDVPGGAMTELPTDTDKSLGPPIQPGGALLAAQGSIGASSEAYIATLARFSTRTAAQAYAARLAATFHGTLQPTAGGSVATASGGESGYGEIVAVANYAADTFWLFTNTEDPTSLPDTARQLKPDLAALAKAESA